MGRIGRLVQLDMGRGHCCLPRTLHLRGLGSERISLDIVLLDPRRRSYLCQYSIIRGCVPWYAIWSSWRIRTCLSIGENGRKRKSSETIGITS